jgi:transcriptional regulator with XRE-family HTH domain
MLYSEQIRAARALLGWRQEDLSHAATVGLATIQRIESGQGPVKGNVSTMIKLQTALEKAGITFVAADETGGPGVRLKPAK